MSVFTNLSIKFKLFIVYAVITLIIFTLSFFLLFFNVRQNIEYRLKEELNTSNQTITDMVETVATVSIKNHLRTFAEKKQEMTRHFYQRFQDGEISERDAKEKARQAILNQTVGDTGYLYCVNSKGIAVVHPDAGVVGRDFSHRRFVQNQIQKKNGYLEYDWKNPDETDERPKALYMTYFEPWDWIISASSYKSEFNKLININDFRERILSLTFGETGYSFIYDFQGNSIIHPELTGNVLELADDRGFLVAREMIRLKKGYLTYWWKNPSEKEPREKFVAFDSIPGVDWIVASSSYTREMFAPLVKMQKTFFLILVLAFVTTGGAALLVSSVITKPLEDFIQRLEKMTVEERSSPLALNRKDEIGKLSSSFNRFMERLHMYRSKLISEISIRKKTEMELRESEERMRNLVEQSPLSIQIIDREGKTTQVNQAWEELWGITWEEISATGYNILKDKQIIDLGIVPYLKRAYDGETVFLQAQEYDASPTEKTTKKHWVTANIYPVKDKAGFVHSVVILQTDITAQKKADDEIKKLNKFRASIIDSLDIWLSVCDSDMNVILWNKAAQKISGYDKHEVIGHNKIWEWLYPDETYHNKIMADAGSIFEKSGVINNFETMIRHKEGSEHIISWHTHILSESREHGTQYISTGRDLTEQRQTETALRKSEKKYKSLYENLPIGVIRVTIEGEIISYNPSCLKIMDFPASEDTNRYNVVDFYRHPEDRELFLEKIKKDGFIKNFEYEVKTFTGEKKFICSNTVLVRDSKGNMCLDSTIEDITQRKLTEIEKEKLESQLRQTQKMEALGTLAGGIAHDFNNILSGIFGFSQLAQNHLNDPERAKKDIEQIVAGAQNATELVRQILTFSRKSTHEKQPLAVYSVVKEALKLLRASMPASIEIIKKIDSKTTIMADPTKIHQVLMNLCTNAYHAMFEKGGILAVGLKDVEFSKNECIPGSNIRPGKYIRLEISDTGSGMDAATKEKIFEPYFTTKTADKGTGLGLAVVFGIVEEHNGYISVYSEPGQGSTFHVHIPIIEEAPEPYIAEESGEIPLSGMETILFVDDEEAVLKSTQGLLQELGYVIKTFESGIKAFEMYKKNPDYFDLVITDMTMPLMSGFELSQKILDLRPEQPIILCTGHSELLNREKALIIGIRHYYEKPIIIKKLSEVIRAVLDDAK